MIADSNKKLLQTDFNSKVEGSRDKIMPKDLPGYLVEITKKARSTVRDLDPTVE